MTDGRGALADGAAAPSFRRALAFWARLGLISFGGPAGQIAIMHRELVERRRWIGEDQFLRGLNFCMLLPGPEAQQLATYVGWRMHGTRGGIAAGVLFVLPAVVVLLGLAWTTAAHGEAPLIRGLLYGIQPVVVGLVAHSLLRVARRALHGRVHAAIAVAAFALLLAGIPFPPIIIGAGLAGLLVLRGRSAATTTPPDGDPRPARPTARSSARRAAALIAVFVGLWALPVGALLLWRGANDVLMQQALFFTQAAFVTFGGAYAVLVHISAAAVGTYGWVTAEQMVQGLGLAESTPGPLIMVNQFVGFLGAWQLHGGYDPLLYGTLGALITTYTTFLPSFLFVLLGAPYIELLAGQRRLQAALAGITAAVVGVIAHLGVFFGGQVLLPRGGPDVFAALAALVSFGILLRWTLPVPWLVLAGAAAGLAWSVRPG